MIRKTPLSYIGDHKTHLVTAGISFLATCVLICLVFAAGGFVPFGNKALLYNDGAIQMIDLFNWYKSVLTGNSSIDYTLTKSLGGSNFSVFTYYLASPLSLLVVFFDRAQAPLFMNLLYLLKASLASAFMSIYLVNRFGASGRSKCAVTVLLSVSYGLGHYMISQCCNTMWLDGVYMLPLILTECERVVKGKRIWRLSLVLALAVCFNWYSGLIDMLFTGFWFIFDLARNMLPVRENRMRGILTAVLRFSEACICALLMSGAILIPTLLKLSGRTYGRGGLTLLTDIGMIGSVKDTILSYPFGMMSQQGSVSLFAGSFVLLGIGLLFIAGSQTLKEKILYGILLVFTVLIFIWQPLVALFSMLRYVESFWYRYSYVGIFALVYLAGAFYLESSRKRLKVWMPLAVSGAFSVIVILLILVFPRRIEDMVFFYSLGLIMPVTDSNALLILCKIIFPLLLSLLLCMAAMSDKNSHKLRPASSALICLAAAAELLCGQFVLSALYSTDNAGYISDYMRNEEALLGTVDDSTCYRIMQTSYHSSHNADLAASYNEPMSFGFKSITSFVSDPDEDTVFFMDRCGYAAHAETITVTTSENLAADSLLGVKYVILPSGSTESTGLQYMDGIESFKDIYVNPYSFPVAFTYEGTGDFEDQSLCPALYLNAMYGRLTGTDDIFTPVNVSESKDGNAVTYTVELGENFDRDRYILYADLPTDGEIPSTLMVNGEPLTPYAQFLAPSMVRISTEQDTVEVTLMPDDPEQAMVVTDAQFYLLDLDLLAQASQTADSRAVTDLVLEDGKGSFTVEDGHKGDSLFVSVPYEDGWTVTLNGREITCDRIGDALMSIPLEDGVNKIEMNYTLPHKYTGIIMSLSGIVLLAVLTYAGNINTRRSSKTRPGGKKPD